MTPQVTVGSIHLVNSTGAPVAGGVATAAATTPFAIRDRWALSVAEPIAMMSGGPPFRYGAGLAYLGYDNVVETIPIHVTGSSHENAVARLQELKRAVNTTLFSTAPLMSVLPTSSSTIMYSEIQYAVVREVTDDTRTFDAWEGGAEIDAEITLARSPFFTPAGLTTLINGATFTNTGTGANNNTQSLGSPAGDLIYEGQPLNIRITPTASDDFDEMWLATVYQRTYTVSAATTTTSSADVAFRDTTSGILNPARTRNGLRARVILRLTNSSSAQVRLQATLVSRNSDEIFWRGPLIAPGGIAGSLQVDLTPHGIPLDSIRQAQLTTGDVDVGVSLFSNDGSSVSVTTASMETLLYYTFCYIDTGITVVGAVRRLYIEQAQNLNGTAYLPTPGRAFVSDIDGGSELLARWCDVRGTLPRAISGASLYLGWNTGNASSTAAVIVSHLPLYRSLRGSG